MSIFRVEQLRIVILSPHRDDAAFSAGLLLWACAQAQLTTAVVNIFTRSEYAPYLDDLGLDVISAAREQEDVAFFGSLPGTVVFGDLDLLDAPVRRGIPVEDVLQSSLTDSAFQTDVAAVAQWLGVLPEFDLLLAPLGLGEHLDHVVTREAARRIAPASKLGFYADLPYAMQGEVSTPPGDFTECRLLAPDGVALKQRLAGCYPSQIHADLAVEIGNFCADGERFFLPQALTEPLRCALEGFAGLLVGAVAR